MIKFTNKPLAFNHAIFVVLVTCALCFPVTVRAISSDAALQPLPHADDAPVLDAPRLNALGMIETGNDDRAVGALGEVSRYQLSPSVWKSYSKSTDYRNPEVSLRVARQHWNYLAAYFKEKTSRIPTDYDMYVMWNTRLGYYARKNFSQQQICAVVQDRAQRFVNLINRKD
jgi:hypothetical protein